MSVRARSALSAAALVAASTVASAQADWTLRTPAPLPGVHTDHTAVWDTQNQRVLVFGGTSPGSVNLNGTLAWNGSSWTTLAPPNMPPPRLRHCSAFDPVRNRLVVFGGSLSFASGFLGDTWEFDGTTWTEIFPANAPSARNDAAMAYDLATGQLLMFGGQDLSGALAETWSWDGTNWTALAPATSPPALRDHTMVYDIVRQRVVVFGGFPGASINVNSNQTWEWDGVSWTQVVTPTTPPGRGGHASAYDLTRQRTVVFSGWGPGNLVDTWEYDGSDWAQRAPVTTPTGRSGHAMAFDVARGQVVLFAGYDTGFQNDTWTLEAVNRASWSPFGIGCTGPVGIPPRLALAPLREPWLGDTMTLLLSNVPVGPGAVVLIGFSDTTWNGLGLPLDLGLIGMFGCRLFVSPDYGTSAMNIGGGNATWSVPIPNQAQLAGGRFWNQAIVVSIGANPLSLIVSNGGAAVIGMR